MLPRTSSLDVSYELDDLEGSITHTDLGQEPVEVGKDGWGFIELQQSSRLVTWGSLSAERNLL